MKRDTIARSDGFSPSNRTAHPSEVERTHSTGNPPAREREIKRS
jgi:hypothetical protein